MYMHPRTPYVPLNRQRARPRLARPGGAGHDRQGERGQVVPLLAVLLVLAGLVGVGLVHLAAAASDRARAKAVADATALAGAGGGRRAALEVAGANGARLDRYETEGFDVIVVVTLDGHSATARARWSPELVGEALSDPATPGHPT